MDIKWLLTPAEPRVHYAFFVGVCTFLGMLVLMPLWRGSVLISVAMLVVVFLLAGVLVKFFMTRSSK